MLDIMKGQLRQLMRTRIIHLTFAVFAVAFLAVIFLEGTANTDNPVRASDFLCGSYGQMAGFFLILLCIVAGFANGADFSDKTLYHELLAGRRRSAVFFGRLIPGAVISVFGTMILLALPIAFLALCNGWGNAIPVSAAVQRLLLMFFPLLRLYCAQVLITFAVKNQIAGFAVSMLPVFALFSLGSTNAAAMSGMKILRTLSSSPYLLSPINCGYLAKFDSWATYGIDLIQHYTYYPALSVSAIALTVTVSLVMCAVYLLVAYHYFHTDDLN